MISERTVTEYVTSDGSVFRKSDEAEAYEKEWEAVEQIMRRIPRTDLKDGEYVTHSPEFLRDIRRCLWTLVIEKFKDDMSLRHWRESNPDEVHPLSIVGRILGDCGGPLSKAWNQLSRFCFASGREFDQPYFVEHQSEAKPREKT